MENNGKNNEFQIHLIKDFVDTEHRFKIKFIEIQNYILCYGVAPETTF